jgi:hypothetical protein
MAKFFTLYDEQPPKPHVEITQPSLADQTLESGQAYLITTF